MAKKKMAWWFRDTEKFVVMLADAILEGDKDLRNLRVARDMIAQGYTRLGHIVPGSLAVETHYAPSPEKSEALRSYPSITERLKFLFGERQFAPCKPADADVYVFVGAVAGIGMGPGHAVLSEPGRFPASGEEFKGTILHYKAV